VCTKLFLDWSGTLRGKPITSAYILASDHKADNSTANSFIARCILTASQGLLVGGSLWIYTTYGYRMTRVTPPT